MKQKAAGRECFFSAAIVAGMNVEKVKSRRNTGDRTNMKLRMLNPTIKKSELHIVRNAFLISIVICICIRGGKNEELHGMSINVKLLHIRCKKITQNVDRTEEGR